MRELIKQQLRACNFANLSNTVKIEGGYLIKIPKYSKPRFELGKMYLISLSEDAAFNSASYLSVTRNNNTVPGISCLKAYIAKQEGRLVYTNCIGFNLNTNCDDLSKVWSGWLDIDDFSLISKL